MAVLSVRNMSEELARQIKSTAALDGVTLREFVLETLEQRVKRGERTAAPEKRKDVKADLQVTVPEQVVAKAIPVVLEKPQPAMAEATPEQCRLAGHKVVNNRGVLLCLTCRKG